MEMRHWRFPGSVLEAFQSKKARSEWATLAAEATPILTQKAFKTSLVERAAGHKKKEKRDEKKRRWLDLNAIIGSRRQRLN